jgi:hypothetical protein
MALWTAARWLARKVAASPAGKLFIKVSPHERNAYGAYGVPGLRHFRVSAATALTACHPAVAGARFIFMIRLVQQRPRSSPRMPRRAGRAPIG